MSDLTPEIKAGIDHMDYQTLLTHWRFGRPGHPIFQGETGDYYAKRMKELRDADPAAAVSASKSIGWDKPTV